MDFEFLELSEENPILFCIDNKSRKNIYHYTTSNGLDGILKTDCLWATKSDFLNDKSEMIYINKVIENVANKLDNNTDCINRLDADGFLYKYIVKYLRAFSNSFRGFTDYNDWKVFVISFTQNKDSLDHFERYTFDKEKKTFGYNIEFDSKELFNFCEPKFDHGMYNGFLTTAGKVIYSLKKQVEIIRNDVIILYNQIFFKLKEMNIKIVTKELYNKIINDINLHFSIKFKFYSLYFKDKHFYPEEEYRMLFIGDNESILPGVIKYRNNSTPYIEYIVKDRLPIKNIKKAPTNSEKLEEFLLKTKYRNVKITRSEIPIR